LFPEITPTSSSFSSIISERVKNNFSYAKQPSTKQKTKHKIDEECVSSSIDHRKSKFRKDADNILSPDDEDWQCMYCHRVYSNDQRQTQWVQCDKCQNQMHVKCVPPQHKKTTKLTASANSGKEFEFFCTDC
jgi:ribosomal protein L37AE/L43A